MKEFRQRRSFKRVLYSPLSITMLVVLLFFLARGAIGAYESESRSRSGLAAAEAQQADLSSRQSFLQSEIDKFSTNRGLEEEFRNKYPVVKPGEKMVIIVEPKAESTSTAPAAPSLWQRIVGFFK